MVSILLSLSVAVLAGLLMTRVFKPLKLPSVTAYLVAGVLVGPYCLGRLGITLLPQAGVALGMCVTAQQLGEQGDLIRNITLFAILIYELIGPMLTKMSLTNAGEIQPMSEEVKNRRKTNLEAAKNTPWERHAKPGK